MRTQYDWSLLRQERYSQWERSAPLTFAVLLAMAVVAQFVFSPSLLVASGCFLGGTVIFFAWRASLVEKTNLTIGYAIIGLLFSFSGFIFSGRVPIPVLMAQSFPWLGVGLFLGILVARLRKKTT